MGWRGTPWGWRSVYWFKGWWCPRNPWPPTWAKAWYPWHWYPVDPIEEVRFLEDVKKDLERQLSEINKTIEELKRFFEERK